MAVKRIRSTVDEREQKSLLMDLEVVMKSKGCPYIVMFNGAIFKVRIFRCTWGSWLMLILVLGEIGNNQIWHKNNWPNSYQRNEFINKFVQKCQYYYTLSDQSIPLETVRSIVSLLTEQLCKQLCIFILFVINYAIDLGFSVLILSKYF